MTVATLSILLLIVCFVALGLWVWAGGVHSDYLEAKWEADYYYKMAGGYRDMLIERDGPQHKMMERKQ